MVIEKDEDLGAPNENIVQNHLNIALLNARNFTTNVAKILDLKSSSEHIFSEN